MAQPSRTLTPQKDPGNDMTLLKVGDVKPTGKIENAVTCSSLQVHSPRTYYPGPWKNVEFQSEVKFVNNMEQSYLVAESNHEERPCGFGGYSLYVDLTDKEMFFKKEISHEECNGKKGYSDRLEVKPVDVKEGVWFKQKIRVRNENGKVRVEGFINDQEKINEIVDEGQIECGDPPDSQGRRLHHLQEKVNGATQGLTTKMKKSQEKFSIET